MKKQLLIIISIAMILAVIVAVANISMAGGTGCDLQLNPSVSTLNPGDEVEITLKIKNITVTQGISGISGNLTYDSNAFEYVSSEVVSNNWNANSTTLETDFTTKNGQGVKADEDIAKFKFRVKSSATAKNYTFTYTNAESKPVEAQVTQEFQTQITTNVTVRSSVTPTNNIIDNTVVNNVVTNDVVDNNTVVNNAVDNNTVVNNVVVNNVVVNNAVVNNVAINANSSNSIVPYTGVKVGLGLTVFVAIIGALVAGIRYKKFNSIK